MMRIGTMKRFAVSWLIAAALIYAASTSHAQNVICPTAPVGTSNNQCASTAFVQNALPFAPIRIGVTPVTGGTSGRILYDNAGIAGEYPITGTAGSVVLSTSPTIASPTLSGTVAGANTIPLTILQQSAANTMLGNWSGSTANVAAKAMPSCADTGGNHLNYVSGTGITCGSGIGSAITALTGDVTATGPGSVAATLATAQPGAHTWALGQTFSSAITYGGVTLSNSVTGTGSMVLSAAPTITGHPTIEGVTSTGATGTGNFVFATSPSMSGVTVTGSFTATGLVTNADLANPSTTVNGQTCTLGASCTVTAAASTITVGTTLVSGGTSLRILYDNAGVLGEYTLTGSGTVVAMGTSPTFVTDITTPIAKLSATSNQLVFQSGGVTGTLSWAPASTNKTITLPNGTTDFTATGGTGQVLRQSTSGAAITVATLACSDLSNGATGCSTATGTSGATIPLLNGANTWSGVQTFTNSDIKLLGSSTGGTTFTSANAGASNFTLTFPAITSTVSTTIASGAKALATGAISSAACTTAQTDTATGTLSTDAIVASFNADPTAVTGYVPLTTGMLTIILYPTADTVNFKVCNNTTSSITPGAVTINWRVVR